MVENEPRYYDVDNLPHPLDPERTVTKQPSATTILGLVSKSLFTQWAANCTRDYILHNCKMEVEEGDLYLCGPESLNRARFWYRKVSEEAMEWGTTLHELLEGYLRFGEKGLQAAIDKAGDAHTERHDRCLDEFRQWCDKHEPELIALEHQVDGFGYSGRTDVIWKIKRFWDKSDELVVALCDFKSGKGSYYETWGYQTAAYSTAYPDEIECHGVLKFNKETAALGKPGRKKILGYKDYTPRYDLNYAIFELYRNIWWLTRED